MLKFTWKSGKIITGDFSFDTCESFDGILDKK